MSTKEEYLSYLNLARQNPQYFIPLLERQLNSFVNEREMPLTEGVLYETNEGRAAWIQARDFLLRQPSLPKFEINEGLCLSASEHLMDICNNRLFGHRGSDGSNFSERILRHCKKAPGAMAQIIGADFDIAGRNNAEMTVLSLIIDDGVKDRGHRRTIFSDVYRYIGWSSGKQGEKILTVFNITESNLQLLSKNNQNNFYSTQPVSSASSKKGHRISEPPKVSDFEFRDISNSLLQKKQKPLDSSSSPFSPSSPQDDRIMSKVTGYSFNGTGTGSSFGSRKGKKVAEKIENSKVFFQEGSKVIETTTKLIYNDGSVEENVDRRTIYLDQ